MHLRRKKSGSVLDVIAKEAVPESLTSYQAPGGGLGPAPRPTADPLTLALADLGPQTRRIYSANWTRFVDWWIGTYGLSKRGGTTNENRLTALGDFLSLHRADAATRIHEYRDQLFDAGARANTVALALRAILGMVRRWHAADVSPWDLRGLVRVPTPLVYQDTKGPEQNDFEHCLKVIDRYKNNPRHFESSTRDIAIFLLLHDSGLRAREVFTLDLAHLDLRSKELKIWGKRAALGERVAVPLNNRQILALQDWMEIREGAPGPLFCRTPVDASLRRLDNDAMLYLVSKWGKRAKLPKKITPHKLRHSAITQLAQQGIDLTSIQRFARHSNPATTGIYIDRARNDVGDLTQLLGGEPPKEKP